MARMNFICDAERCIEYNACVTACKNQNEVPRASIDAAWSPSTTASQVSVRFRSPACTALIHRVWQFARWIASIRPATASCCTLRVCASVADTASTHIRSARLSPRRLATSAAAERWTHAPSAPVGSEENMSTTEFKKYGRNRLAGGKLPLCAEMCSIKALLAGDGNVVLDIYRERVVALGYGSGD